MKFRKYLFTLGDQAAGRLFRVKPRTVQSWRLGTRYPSIKQARRIVEKSGGKITYTDIYK